MAVLHLEVNVLKRDDQSPGVSSDSWQIDETAEKAKCAGLTRCNWIKFKPNVGCHMLKVFVVLKKK
jgi:hypothetical protein